MEGMFRMGEYVGFEILDHSHPTAPFKATETRRFTNDFHIES